MIFFRGRCSTLSTLCFFFVAGAAFEHVMLFFSWQAQHFEHVMVQNWALVVARCSIVTWCSRKKNYIYIFSLNREHHVMIEGFRVARWPFSIVTWCPVVVRAAF